MIRNRVGNDLRGAWGFAAAVPRRGSWAQETALQALKAAIAAVLAWFVAAHLLDVPQSYLAPWVALVVVRPTVHWSVLTGLRQVAAVAIGVLVAVVSVALMPDRELALAVCVPVAFLLSYWPRLDDQGMYVPFTALFMVAVGSVEEPFVLFRLLETGLGAAIGMGINLLVAPPVRVLTVEARARRDGEATVATLRELAGRLREDDGDPGEAPWSSRVRRLNEHVAETREALQHARDGLRLNPRSGETRLQDSIGRTRRGLDLVRRVDRSVHALADVLDDARCDGMPDPSLDSRFREECGAVLDEAADMCEQRLAVLLAAGDAASGPSSADLTGRLAALEHRTESGGTRTETALLVGVRRILLELAR